MRELLIQATDSRMRASQRAEVDVWSVHFRVEIVEGCSDISTGIFGCDPMP